MSEKNGSILLDGAAAICEVMNRSYRTMMDLKRRNPEMPIKKDPSGNRWIAQKSQLMDWWAAYLLSDKTAMSEAGLSKKELAEQEAIRNPKGAAAGDEGGE